MTDLRRQSVREEKEHREGKIAGERKSTVSREEKEAASASRVPAAEVVKKIR
jgi:hypothetical protein